MVRDVKGPNSGGSFSLVVPVAPVSTQARRAQKDIVTAEIRKLTSVYDFLLSGDVAIDLAWYVREDARYETDASADVDNILKPTFDALSGPQGVLINDSQVQHLTCHWQGGLNVPEHFTITVEYDPEEWFAKKSLGFVIVRNNLCMPLDLDQDPGVLLLLLDTYEKQFDAHDRLLTLGASPTTARGLLSVQRVFHRSRTVGFPVEGASDLRARLSGSRV